MQAVSEQALRCLHDMAFDLAVHFETGRAGEPEELGLVEMPDNVPVHVAELAPMAFINDEDDLFILIRVHDLRVSGILYGIGHLLDSRNDQVDIPAFHLVDKDPGVVRNVYAVRLEFIELLHGLGVQILPVHQEDDLLDAGLRRKDLGRLEAGQGLSAAGGMSDIGVLVGEPCPVYQGRSRIYLVGPHDHDGLVHIIKDCITQKHAVDMVPCQEGDGEVLELGDPDILFIGPEEGQAVEDVPVRVGEILGINAV